LGKLTSNPEAHDQLVALFQIFRWLAGGFLVYAVFQFSNLFLFERKNRRNATVLILVGGGLGWLGWLALPSNWTGRLPLEFYSPEAFGFLSLVGLPHLAAARAFLLLGLAALLKRDDPQRSYPNAISGGFFWLIAGFFQPLTILVGFGIIGVYFLLHLFLNPIKDWRNSIPLLKKCAVMALISLPWVIYNFFSFANDAYLREWYAQNVISSPPVQDYIWSFGLFFVAAFPAIFRIIKNRETNGMLLVSWIICAGVLAYIPYNVQRRFIDGIWIALILLIVSSYEMTVKKKNSLGYKTVLSLSLIAPVLVMLIISQGVWHAGLPVFRPSSEVAMFNKVAEIAIPGDVVLCSYETGNAIPAWAPVRVMAGHGPESANLKAVLPEVNNFFGGGKDLSWQNEFINKNKVRFIIAGPAERNLGNWETTFGRVYQLIYRVEGYSIYKVEDVSVK
jgi:hypothetical protein